MGCLFDNLLCYNNEASILIGVFASGKGNQLITMLCSEAGIIQLALMAVGHIFLSWVVSLIKAIRARRQERYEEDDIAWQIRRAREMGVPLTNITFDSNNSLIDPRTGKPVNYSAGR